MYELGSTSGPSSRGAEGEPGIHDNAVVGRGRCGGYWFSVIMDSGLSLRSPRKDGDGERERLMPHYNAIAPRSPISFSPGSRPRARAEILTVSPLRSIENRW